jgi:hypothetical protein
MEVFVDETSQIVKWRRKNLGGGLMRYAILLASALAVAVSTPLLAVDAGKEPAEIKLDTVWALNMPGTRDIRELEPRQDLSQIPNSELAKSSLVAGISAALSPRNRPREGEQAGPAFVVLGEDKVALKNAHAVLTSKKRNDPDRWMPPNTKLSLVFYEYSCGRFVHVVSAEKTGKLITVEYQLVPHITLEMTRHFALIPIGEFPPGTFQVRFVEVPFVAPDGAIAPPMHNVERVVSNSFSFGVR